MCAHQLLSTQKRGALLYGRNNSQRTEPETGCLLPGVVTVLSWEKNWLRTQDFLSTPDGTYRERTRLAVEPTNFGIFLIRQKKKKNLKNFYFIVFVE